MAGENQGELFDGIEVVLLREDVDGVFDRVGGDDGAVVAGGVGGGEVAFELDVGAQLEQVVALPCADDLRQPDAALAVGVVPQGGGHRCFQSSQIASASRRRAIL